MLLCDYCLKWYHAKCEEVVGSDNIEMSQSFKCANCTAWQEKFDNVFKSVLDTNSSDEILVPTLSNSKQEEPFSEWLCWKRTLFPKGPSHFLTLDDIILIGALWQKQIESLESCDSVINLDLIRQQVVIAHFIPLNLSHGVAKLNNII